MLVLQEKTSAKTGETVQRLALHSRVSTAIFGIACDVSSHPNFSLMLCMLTRKLHTTKVSLFSPVISLWFISGCTHQETPVKPSTVTNAKSKAYTPAQSTSVDSLSSKNSLNTLSRSVLTVNRRCQMLLHYLKLHAVSQY